MKKIDALKELKWRGIINNITDEEKLVNLLNSDKDYGIYCGFDPSFKSLHLGNYVMIRILKIFKKYGVKTIAVIGGATGMIGDPSGKSEERNLLDIDTVLNNIKCVEIQLKKYTNADIIFNNADIWINMNIVTFLRDIGKNFNVNTMLEKDIVKNRLETGISYSEFTYSILQSYDWVELYKKYNIAIQCGGSDQWGNLTAGTNLFRKLYGENHNAVGLTINLLLKSDGKKFGKSEKGAIYFDKDITSVYQMYQFLINQADNDLEKLFKFFTDFNENEINEILKKHFENPKLRYGQNCLADAIVNDIHGKEELMNAKKISKLMFEEKYNELTINELDDVFKNYDVSEIELKNENIVDFLKNTNTILSNREIRTLIEQKGLKINGNIVESFDLIIDQNLFINKKYLLIKKGKKNFYVFKLKNI